MQPIEHTTDAHLQKFKQKQLLDDIKALGRAWDWAMADARGRMLIWALMEEFGIYKTTFDSNGQEAAKKAGYREAALYIREQIKAFVGQSGWRQMETEAANRVDQNDVEMQLEIKRIDELRKGK